MSRVFLSYRHVEPDKSIANFIYRHLVDRDHDVFFDSANLPMGKFWDKEIKANVERAEYFVPLVSLAYLNSEYILDNELSAAARLLKAKEIEGILQVNLAFDGKPPDAVKDVVNEIQFFKWRSSEDTPELARKLAAALPAPKLLVKGMRSFTTTDGPQFPQLGRAARVSEFVDLLSQPAIRLTLLHGVSGSGKTSFIEAGVKPNLGNQRVNVVELERETPDELDALVSADSAVIILDQFEQSLVRLSADEQALAAFVTALESQLQIVPTLKLVFCIRDEYRTAFDTMLPAIASQCALFPLLPLDVDAAATVLGLLLENVRVPYDPQFVPALCNLLAEGVPRTVLPALLQIIAQHFQNNNLCLNGGTWDRLLKPGKSLFEQHVNDTLLRALPLSVSKLDACRTLTAVTSGNVKSPFQAAAKIAEDCGLNQVSVKRTLDIAALPSSRIVTVEVDGQSNTEQYRLAHDLFAPAVQSLARRAEAEKATRNRWALTTSLVFGALMLAIVFAILYRNAVRETKIATSRQLAVAELMTNDTQPDLASLLAIEAARKDDNSESRNALALTFTSHPRLMAYLHPLEQIWTVASTPDGKIVASQDRDGIIKLWNVARRQSLGKPLDGGKVYINRGPPAFSPDGRILASVLESQILLWEVATQSPLRAALRGCGDFSSVAFSPDGKTLAATCSGAVQIWSVANWQLSGEYFAEHQPKGRQFLYSLAFSPDGKLLASGSSHGDIWIWDVATRQIRGSPLKSDSKQWIYGLAFSPDGKLLASADKSEIRLWDMASQQHFGKLTQTLQGGSLSVVFSAEGKILAADAPDRAIRLWNIANWHDYELRGHHDSVTNLASGSSGNILVSASLDGTVGLWDVDPDRAALDSFDIAPLDRHEAPVFSVAFSPDGKLLAVASDRDRYENERSARPLVKGIIRLWDMKTRQALPDLSGGARSICFSPDGSLLASAAGGEIRLWDVVRREPFGDALTGHNGLVNSVAFNPDGKILGSAGDDGTVRLWDVASRRPLVKFGGPGEKLIFNEWLVAFRPHGGMLASIGGDGFHIWDVARRQPLRSPFNSARGYIDIDSVAFSPDGKILASGSSDGSPGSSSGGIIQLWDVGSWRELGDSLREQHAVGALAFSPDGKMLAAAGEDGTVQLWDVPSQQPLGKVLKGHKDRVTSLAFSPDGRTLVSASRDKTVRLWDVSPESWATAACQRANRNLSLGEWQQYMGRDIAYHRSCPSFPNGAGAPAK